MKNYTVKIKVNGKEHHTRAGILPDKANPDISLIAKSQAPLRAKV